MIPVDVVVVVAGAVVASFAAGWLTGRMDHRAEVRMRAEALLDVLLELARAQEAPVVPLVPTRRAVARLADPPDPHPTRKGTT